MGLLENKARARLFYKYLSRVYDRVNPFIWNAEMRTRPSRCSNSGTT